MGAVCIFVTFGWQYSHSKLKADLKETAVTYTQFGAFCLVFASLEKDFEGPLCKFPKMDGRKGQWKEGRLESDSVSLFFIYYYQVVTRLISISIHFLSNFCLLYNCYTVAFFLFFFIFLFFLRTFINNLTFLSLCSDNILMSEEKQRILLLERVNKHTESISLHCIW